MGTLLQNLGPPSPTFLRPPAPAYLQPGHQAAKQAAADAASWQGVTKLRQKCEELGAAPSPQNP